MHVAKMKGMKREDQELYLLEIYRWKLTRL